MASRESSAEEKNMFVCLMEEKGQGQGRGGCRVRGTEVENGREWIQAGGMGGGYIQGTVGAATCSMGP